VVSFSMFLSPIQGPITPRRTYDTQWPHANRSQNGDGYDDFICIGPEGNMYVLTLLVSGLR
jgi:hypothetical protein